MKATSYKLIKSFDEFELRKYTPATVVEIIENGNRENALLKAKRKLVTLMSDNNSIVINESSNNGGIPEVLMEPSDILKQWKFEFFLENHDLLLCDVQNKLQVKNLSEKNYDTIKISGLMSNGKIIQKILLLKSWLAKEKLLIIGKPKIAEYKPYRKIAFLKKVEIYIEVEPIISRSSLQNFTE